MLRGGIALPGAGAVGGRGRGLTEKQKGRIMELYLQGVSHTNIALRMGLSRHTVGQIIRSHTNRVARGRNP